MESVPHKQRLRRYFDGIGFERWSAIYGDSRLSPIRQTIRTGHNAMLAFAAAWLDASPPLETALDAGCGTGLFAVALARRGLAVTAADIAPQMVAATSRAAAAAGLADRVTPVLADLDALHGNYALVACFDVLIHYPPELLVPMLRRLASLATDSLLFTYAPSTPLLAALHRLGGFFPRSQRRTEIQMIPARLVEQTLAAAGFATVRSQRVSSGFYHVTLVQARRVGSHHSPHS